MDKPELLPCPFCAGTAQIDELPGPRYRAGCDTENCLASITWRSFITRHEAIAAWNTRTPSAEAEPHRISAEDKDCGIAVEGLGTDEGLVEAVARAIHGYCCQNMVMTYLEEDEDCEALARAAIPIIRASVEDEVRELREALKNPPKHNYWGAGEPDCPQDIKCGNGELHTLRCKVCGEDSPRNEICLAAIAGLADA